MRLHRLTLADDFFESVKVGQKRFAIRLDDRNYSPGDLLMFHRVVDGVMSSEAVGPYCITYLLKDWIDGLCDGYCAFSFECL